jgi:hypothetical protein
VPFSARRRPVEMSRQSRPQAARSRGRAVAVKPSRRTMRAAGIRRGAVRIEADGRGAVGDRLEPGDGVLPALASCRG